MIYTALARKWRPRIFPELLGQEHVKKILINSLQLGRLHHAYLFTGPQGVGKTSVARLFAKSLNCQQGVSATPCLHCDNCISIEQGRFIDLIEVDGASRTRVEDTRELLENIQYVPSSGRFKIYLIDEVHMLSTHSFNALLKTLEEPPEHVKFLLATTDPQKLPITVLSRCLQFNLKYLPTETICDHLHTILNEEKLDYDNTALQIIAKAARGSVRDSLSLLDQAIAGCSEGKLTTQDVQQLLGYSQQNYALQLLQALGKMDPNLLLTISRNIAVEGGQFQYVLDELLNYLHQISIDQLVPNRSAFITQPEEIHSLAQQFTPEDTQLFYQIGIKSQEDMQLAPTPAIAFEMMMLRMYAFKPCDSNSRPPRSIETTSTSKATTVLPVINTTIETPATAPCDTSATSATSAEMISTKTNTSDSVVWSNLLPTLNLTGLTLNAAENAEFIKKENQQVTLRVNKGHTAMFTPTIITRIETALSSHFSEAIKIALINTDLSTTTPASEKQTAKEKNHQHAHEAMQNDPVFQKITHEFSAELVKNSITPLKNSLQLA